MINKVLSTIKKYNMLSTGDGVVIGISGGADSVSLACVLCELRPRYVLRLYAVHLNHCIRGNEADGDEEFVRRLCECLGIELFTFRRDIPSIADKCGLTLEEAGRKVRYELFDKVLKDTASQKIAVAHNMNDNAETLLMRLCRGTGIKGLGGISPVRDNIIRPLIEVKRSEIEAYCNKMQLSYRTDSTNLVEDYTRNKIRLTLIPWLEQNLNPSVCDGLNKTAQFMRDEDEYLDELAERAYGNCLLESGTLSCEKLLTYDAVIRRRVVRLLFATYVVSLKDISSEHINAVCRLAEGKSGASLSLPYSLTAKKEYDRLIITKESDTKAGYSYATELNKPLFLPELNVFVEICDKKTQILGNLLYTNCFKCDIINDRLYLRTRQSGDVIHLKGVGTKKIKKLFTDLKIRRSERDLIPMLAVGSDILWLNCGKIYVNDKYATEDGNLYFYMWN
jgi:tRNA(Ile)-lysidine synthase